MPRAPRFVTTSAVIAATVFFGFSTCVSIVILLHTAYAMYFYKSLPRISNGNSNSNSNSNSTHSNPNNQPTNNSMHTTEDMNNCIRHTTTTSICFFLSTNIAIFIRMLFSLAYGYYIIYAKYRDYMTLPLLIFYLIARWTMLLSFILRLDNTFRDSVYQYKPCVIRILYIMLFVSLLYMIVLSTLFLPGSDENPLIVEIRGYMTIIVILYEFIFINLLMILFIRKLFDLFSRTVVMNNTQNIAIDLSVNSASSISNHSNAMEAVSKDLLFVTIKYALLVTVSVLSTQILLGSIIGKDDFEVVVFIGMDAFVNGLCLYLLNKFAKKMYIVICKLPHTVCNKWCVCLAHAFIKN